MNIIKETNLFNVYFIIKTLSMFKIKLVVPDFFMIYVHCLSYCKCKYFLIFGILLIYN